MSNIFKNTRFMMGLSIVCGIASLVLGGISLYYKEYIIGGALIFNIFICFLPYSLSFLRKSQLQNFQYGSLTFSAYAFISTPFQS